ncbi:methylglyoxal synthase [Candidatus Bathyarchaeota archaeon]|nr:methylglyoxal synthase [Candidatus Bathyarchaeota archaeon]
MKRKEIIIGQKKNIALVAHDNKKENLLEWVRFNKNTLQKHKLFATGTTGKLLEDELDSKITIFESGPLGGDQQVGSRISEGKIDFLIFFWDPLESQSHDPDVKALLRMAVVWNIPTACNRASADFLISSPLMSQKYSRSLPNYNDYRQRLKKS